MTKPLPDLSSDDRRLSVLVVDDQEIVLWGFRLVLARQTWVSRCIGARTGDQATAIARRFEPNIALVDLVLAAESGADVCERIRAASPSTRVLLMSGNSRVAPGVLRSVGAVGFIPKNWPAAEIAAAVHAAALGAAVVNGRGPLPYATLSNREEQVLKLVATGATNREIAEEMQISANTVKEYLLSVRRKLGARNRAEAVHRGQKLGLLE